MQNNLNQYSNGSLDIAGLIQPVFSAGGSSAVWGSGLSRPRQSPPVPQPSDDGFYRSTVVVPRSSPKPVQLAEWKGVV